ncbi:hypothetical protein M8C21_028404, partial [Ambrosia artemisiifolia]
MCLWMDRMGNGVETSRYTSRAMFQTNLANPHALLVEMLDKNRSGILLLSVGSAVAKGKFVIQK